MWENFFLGKYIRFFLDGFFLGLGLESTPGSPSIQYYFQCFQIVKEVIIFHILYSLLVKSLVYISLIINTQFALINKNAEKNLNIKKFIPLHIRCSLFCFYVPRSIFSIVIKQDLSDLITPREN